MELWFINQQIQFLLETDHKLVVENLSIEWGVSILGYNDKLFGTNHLLEVYDSTEWSKFEDELKKLNSPGLRRFQDKPTFYELIRPKYESTFYEAPINKLMDLLKVNDVE
jgi:hypothetical protein